VIHPPFGPNRTCWGSNVIAPQSLGGVRRIFVGLTLSDWTLDMRLTTSLSGSSRRDSSGQESSGQWCSLQSAAGDTCSAVRSGRFESSELDRVSERSALHGRAGGRGAVSHGSRARAGLALDDGARSCAGGLVRFGAASGSRRSGARLSASRSWRSISDARSCAAGVALRDVSSPAHAPRVQSPRVQSPRVQSPRVYFLVGGGATRFSSLAGASSSRFFPAVRSRIATVRAPRVGRRRIDRP
jgi:hypothetical protein